MQIKRLCDEFTVSEGAREIEQFVGYEMTKREKNNQLLKSYAELG